ncbi:ribonuclease H-like domain-containing protein [Tanacetum coccineum]
MMSRMPSYNGDLSETVYMSHPLRFRDSTHPNYVCLLQRSLYGLKQAHRAWFQRFASYITHVGFHHNRCDSSVFVYKQGTTTAYLLLYIDDILLTTSLETLLQQIISSLHQKFSMIDLGSLNYFLSISVTRDSFGMFLSQRKYAVEILERAHMANCNPSRTHVDNESKLGYDGESDHTLYRSLAGSLQEPHFSALKRIFTLDHGLRLFSSSTTSLVAYSDADWAGFPTTRRSASKYRGVANAVVETCWLRNLLHELHTPLSFATLVYCDNVRVLHVPSRYQYEDIFTKGLSSRLFEEFRTSLSVGCLPAPTAKEC